MGDETSRGWRWTWRAAALAAVLVLLLVAVVGALHLPPVQRALLRRAAVEVEARSGLRLAAEAVRLRPFGIRLDLTRPSLAVSGAAPFLTAESLTVEVAPLSLARGPVRVRRFELVGPRLDGTRPLPKLPEPAAATAERPSSVPVVVDSLRVTGGSAAGFEPPAAVAALLGSVTADELEIEGRLEEGRLALAARVGRLRSLPAGRPPVEVAVEADIDGDLAGPLRLGRLVVDGEAISVTASGLLGLTADQPLAVEVAAEADVARLLTVEVDGAPVPVRLGGRLDLRRMEGDLKLQADDLPGELARPWLAADLYERSALAGSRLGATGAASLAEGRLAASADLAWSRGEDLLATASLAASGELDAPAVPVEVDLRLMPGAVGERRVEARLLLSREAATDLRVEESRLRLAVPDLESELARLRGIWPGWLPELPAGLAAGPLRARGRFQGPLTGLEGRLEGEWSPAAGAIVRMTAAGALPPRPLEANVAVEGLPLARFVDGGLGRLAGSARLTLAGGGLAGELSLSGEGVGHGELRLDAARLEASFDDSRARVLELIFRQGERTLRVTGEVGLGRQTVADLDFDLEGGWGPLVSAVGRLRLADGALLLDVPRAELAGAAARLSIKAPLGALADLPGGEALRELPTDVAEGPLEIAWELPTIDWAAAVAPEAGATGPSADRWMAGARGRLTLDPSSPVAGEGEIEVVDVALERAGHTLVAASPLRLTLAAGRLALAPVTMAVDGHPVDLEGEARLAAAWSVTDAVEGLVEEARLVGRGPAAAPFESAELTVSLRHGELELTGRAGLLDGGSARLRAAAPLAPLVRGEGPLELDWDVPVVDWTPWLVDAAAEETVLTRLEAGIAGRLRLNLEEPAKAAGELRAPALEVEMGDQSIRAREPLELRLADGRLEVVSARMLASGAPLDLSGRVDLDPTWRLGAPPASLVRELSLAGGGVLPAALLNPFLAGGAGEGVLMAELEVSGPPEEAQGLLRLRGPGAGFFFASPYALEVSDPELSVRLETGSATFEGAARLNEGQLAFDGRAHPQDGLALEARLEGVRAVLDYGLLTLLDGDLRLTLTPELRGLLAGRVIVDSGQLTRPIRLESLLLDQLLPADLLGSELDPLEAVALDLRLVTRQGVRVKNNLADLKVRWQPIAVRGNLVQPIIEGRLEVDPGGLVYAYGQTLRLDSASLVYRGLPDEVPILEAQTTTSFEDPTIGRLAGDDAFAPDRLGPRDAAGGEEAPGARAVAGEALTTGLASFLGEQISGSVGEALGGTRIGFRPLLVFGEADPGARLTASSDLSARATVAASVDLRNAERQTYLLDLHDEEAAARLSAQLFTNDLGNQGATLQQRLEFGGTRRRVEGPRLRRLSFDRVPGVRRRALRRAAGYRRGDRLAEGAAFEISVAVGELLRERGYPDARVRVESLPAQRRSGVELAVGIETGPRVEFRFTGESLSRPLRRAVAQLYRGDFYEPQAIEEMRLEATRAWRSRGHLEPQVTVRREVLAGGPPERRRVTVDSVPGERLDLGPPRFTGLPAGEAAELSALFGTPLRRTELAAGLPATERRALDGLLAMGYPDALVAARRLSPDGRLLTVEIEPGERLRIAVIEFVDASGARTEVGQAGGLRAGDPVRADRLSNAALEVAGQLREAGYLDAEVTLTVEPLGADRPAERRAVFRLDRGPLYRLGETAFAGLGATRPSWARRKASLTEGETLAPAALREARRRLFGTGLFSAVGTGVDGAREGGARVLFEVEEEPRYRVAYGMRWESEAGTSLVVDVLDRNFSGRGVDIGMRALWSEEVQQLRLSGSLPGVLGPKSRLELFAFTEEDERLVEEGEVRDNTRTVEGTVQLGWQLGRRTTGRVYARYRDVDFSKTFLVEDPFFGPIDPIEVRVKRPFLGLQYIFDSRDDQVAPGGGLFASLDLSFSDESIGGDIRFARLFGQLHSFRPVGRLAGRRLTWAQSVRLGRAEAFSGQELPDDLWLLAGGEYSVRGYRRESLGPPELIGRVLPSVEENSLFVLNEELRFDIREPLSGLLFLDAGNVWIEDDIDFDLFTSLGLGLRAETPVGLLRLDVAWPLDRRDGVDPGVKLYFGLGNVF